MPNQLTPQGGSGNALTITAQYPVEKYNVLVPMQTVAEISEIHRPVMNVVQISTNLEDKEIYEQEKAKKAWRDRDGYDHPAIPAKYALTKKGLTKLMRAAGIKILSSKPVVPSTCQKCAAMNASIGKPVRCGACPNKDVKYEVRISVPQLTGENIDIVAHKEIIVDDVVDGMSDKQRSEFLKFRNEMCESKALNRALRTALQIKGTYLLEEFRKPFVVAYLVPNLNNEKVQEAAIEKMFSSAHEIYGTTPTARDARRTIYVDDDLHDEERGGYEAPETPAPVTGGYGGYQGAAPQEPPRQTRQGQRRGGRPQQPEPTEGQFDDMPGDGDPLICASCGAAIQENVSDYSIRHFGAPLCRDCQRKEQRK